METNQQKTYAYRWVILLVFMAATAMNQLLWITFAPITNAAADFYEVSDLSIALLSMSFMIVFIIFSIPASWVIDTYGFRKAVNIGAALTGIFGVMRGLVDTNYTLVLIAQIGIAIGQPFILNALTTVAAHWFPTQERATASGLGSLAIYLGILVSMVLTPYLVSLIGITSMLTSYGISALVSATAFFICAREYPPSPAGFDHAEKHSENLSTFKKVMKNKQFLLLMVIFFIGLGVFNAVTTWIEDIIKPRGFSATQAGLIGGLMIVGGIAGALVIPTLSDRNQKRIPFIKISIAGSALSLLILTFTANYAILLVSSFLLGFFLLSAGPIGFQYGAEITYPVPEGTSNGMLLLMGQISGILFIIGMDILRTPETGAMTPALTIQSMLLLIGVFLCMALREPKTLLIEHE